jgi:hypothetical protein
MVAETEVNPTHDAQVRRSRLRKEKNADSKKGIERVHTKAVDYGHLKTRFGTNASNLTRAKSTAREDKVNMSRQIHRLTQEIHPRSAEGKIHYSKSKIQDENRILYQIRIAPTTAKTSDSRDSKRHLSTSGPFNLIRTRADRKLNPETSRHATND